MQNHRIEIIKDLIGRYRFQLVNYRGNVLFTSQGYRFRWTAKRGAWRFKKAIISSPIMLSTRDFTK